jgi:DNA modification methylase
VKHPVAVPEWPADKVERRPTGSLIPYARNARTHSPEQISQIAASIREWGWTVPVLLDEQDGIIAGHGRVLAAKKLGLQEIPCMVARGWSEAQRQAYVLADNKLTLNGGWDNDLLKGALGDLQGMDFDLSLTGFSMDEIGMLTADKTVGLTDPDEAPEPPVDPVTELGDVWLLGNHRLVCGDSTSVESVDNATRGQSADFVFTSPPYAQQRVYKSGAVNDWDALMNGVFSMLPVKDGAQVLVNLGLVHRENEWVPYWAGWVDWMASAGWRRFGWYVWDKLAAAPGDWNGRLAPAHEWIFHFNKHTSKLNKTVAKQENSIEFNSHGTGLRGKNGKMSGVSNRAASMQTHKIPDSVIRIVPHKGRGKVENSHPALFPVALVEYVSAPFTKEGDTLYEPFSGSGTTIIAGEMTGRSVHAIELSPAYVDVAVVRWQNFTGQLATLEATGKTFSATMAKRKPRQTAAA